jgi:hypothetical protein
MRPVTRTVPKNQSPAPAHKKHVKWRLLPAVVIVFAIVIATLRLGTGHAASTQNAIRSGYPDECLDIFHGDSVAGTPIDTANCNNTPAQNWKTTDVTIQQLGTNNCVTANTKGLVTLEGCANGPNQIWLRDQQGYYNPNTAKCLSESSVGVQLQLGSCNNMSWVGVAWTPDTDAQAPICSGAQSQMVACEAVKEWTAWQTPNSNHESLLTTYTDGTPFEAWCADFVSYVYKESGYPFTNGSADGWDQNNANSIQYMGFTVHQAGSGYIPRPGDVAFFDYPGGHVEIVVSGGKTPTFVYGNSPINDPATGNGQMNANTVIQDDYGVSGQLLYYMTPNGA